MRVQGLICGNMQGSLLFQIFLQLYEALIFKGGLDIPAFLRAKLDPGSMAVLPQYQMSPVYLEHQGEPFSNHPKAKCV